MSTQTNGALKGRKPVKIIRANLLRRQCLLIRVPNSDQFCTKACTMLLIRKIHETKLRIILTPQSSQRILLLVDRQ